MKKAFIICLVSLFATALRTNAQMHDTSASISKENYVLKSKNQKTTAWILLGGGAAATITGLAIGTNKLVGNIANDTNKGEAVFYTGLAMMGVSIPFFILSNKNAKKASLAISNDLIPQILNGNMVYHNAPSIKLKITLP